MLHIFGLVGMFLVTSAKICPDQAQTDTPDFTDTLGNEDMVRWGQSIAIRCCAEGYDQISWYRKEASSWVSYPPAHSSSYITPTLEEKQQVLRINKATMSDSTLFQCDLVKNGTKVKQHQMKLIVQRCDLLPRGPIPTDPYPQNQTITNFGENVTLSCTGYFGCGDDSEKGFVYWKVMENGEPFDVNSVRDRYSMDRFSRSDEVILGINLTISNVQPEDLGRTFYCQLISPQIKSGSHNTVVRIFKKEVPAPGFPTLFTILITFGGIVGLLFIVTLVSCGVKRTYGPQVTLYVKSHLPRLTPAPKRGEKDHNGLLYHADDDTRQADEIREQLREKGYDIFMSDDVGGNRSLRVYAEKVKLSITVMFLYSKNLREDNFAHFLLQSLINEDRAKDILFLVIDDYVPENVKATTDAAYDPENIESIVEMDGDERDPTELAEACRKNNDLSFWKSLQRYNVPSETASKRQKENFICWLQNKIPKFQDQLVKKRRERQDRPRRRTSSGRRLLDSQGQAEQAISPPNSGNIVGVDEVFNLSIDGSEAVEDNNIRQDNSHATGYTEERDQGYNGIVPRHDGFESSGLDLPSTQTAQASTNPAEPTSNCTYENEFQHRPTLTLSGAIDIKDTQDTQRKNQDTVYNQDKKTEAEMASGRSERSQSTKLSARQSSGESGYGTTPSDRGLSPQYTENNVFETQLGENCSET